MGRWSRSVHCFCGGWVASNAFRSLQTLQGPLIGSTEALFMLELDQILLIKVIWLHKHKECHRRIDRFWRLKHTGLYVNRLQTPG